MSKEELFNILENEEKIDLGLRKLYKDYGYRPYKLGRFEEYDLYSRNRDFIPKENIITLTGQDGKLLALRPDLTLSIVKNYRGDAEDVEKCYYSETVYRSDRDGDFRSFRQTGLECLGNIDDDMIAEVLELAARSLEVIGGDFIMELSHMGFLQSLMDDFSQDLQDELLKAIGSKNGPELDRIITLAELDEDRAYVIRNIATLSGDFAKVKAAMEKANLTQQQKAYFSEIEKIYLHLEKLGFEDKVLVDFSIVNNMSYYSGILFKGYVKGMAKSVLSGGRYDGVMEKMGKAGGAIGFAVYLDSLENVDHSEEGEADDEGEGELIRIALPKGRIGQQVYDLFEKAGYSCPEIKEDNRKLVFTSKENGVSFFWVKPSDVTAYVEHGVADMGVCGKDIIMEYAPDVYEVLDLGIGKCRMCVAGEAGTKVTDANPLRVATKFPKIARRHFARESRDIDIIELHGSIELAPLLGLSDVIVDIVETGTTLKENKLEVLDEVCEISARIIANKALSKFKRSAMNRLVDALAEEI